MPRATAMAVDAVTALAGLGTALGLKKGRSLLKSLPAAALVTSSGSLCWRIGARYRAVASAMMVSPLCAVLARIRL